MCNLSLYLDQAFFKNKRIEKDDVFPNNVFDSLINKTNNNFFFTPDFFFFLKKK